MRLTALFLFFLALPAASIAQNDLSVTDCLGISSDSARLTCYDRVFNYQEPEEIFESGDGWIMLRDTDEFNGADVSRVYIEEQGRAGERNAAVLSVGCRDDGSYFVLFYKATFINTSSRVAVRYRFDDNPPISENWFGTTGGNGALLPDSYRDFRTQLVAADTLVFEAQDFQGARHRHTFEGLQNNRDDLEFVMNGCQA